MTDDEPKPVESMSDVELLRAVTVDRDTFTRSLITALEGELSKRGRSVMAASETAQLRIGGGDETEQSAQDTLRAIRDLNSPTTVAVITNAIGDRLGVQAIRGSWLTHLSTDDAYVGAAHRANVDDVAESVLAHLAFDRRRLRSEHDMDGWESALQTTSRPFLERVADRLAATDVAFILHGPELGFIHLAFAHPAHGLELFVREADARAAQGILDEEEKAIDGLFGEAESHAESGDTAAELAVYEQLALLKPRDPMVHYNRGAILMDLDRASEAVESFMEAVPLLLADEKLRGYVPDVRTNIEALADRCDDPNAALHGLAQIDAFGGDLNGAATRYQAILGTREDDSVAHLHLAQIYFEDGDRDDDAATHFRRYLELEPDAPDRAQVEAQLRELEAS